MSKGLLVVLMILCFAGAATMYILGNDGNKLTELLDFWFYPIPLGILCLIGLTRKKKTPAE